MPLQTLALRESAATNMPLCIISCASPTLRRNVDKLAGPRIRQDWSMQIFVETERLLLRRFTEDDVDNLVELDSDPDVMRFVNGGRSTPRQEIESDVLPKFLDLYERF